MLLPLQFEKLKETIDQLDITDREAMANAILAFYQVHGWDNEREINPTKIHLHHENWNSVCKLLFEKFPQHKSVVAMHWMNWGPSGDEGLIIPEGQILLEPGSGLLAIDVI